MTRTHLLRSNVRNHRNLLELEDIVVITFISAGANDGHNGHSYVLALGGGATHGIRCDQRLLRGRERMGRPGIIRTRHASNFTVPHIAKATAMAKNVERARIAVLRRVRSLGIRLLVIEEDVGGVAGAGVIQAVKDEVYAVRGLFDQRQWHRNGNIDLGGLLKRLPYGPHLCGLFARFALFRCHGATSLLIRINRSDR